MSVPSDAPAPELPHLRVELPNGSTQRVTLGASTSLGRDPGCTVVLDDPMVSRSHAEVRRTPEGRFALVDMGSSHGTYVAGHRITHVVLNHLDEFVLGTTRIRYVDPGRAEKVDRETFSVDTTDAWVQQRVRIAADMTFPPASSVDDAEGLRQGYEKLRAAYQITKAIGTHRELDEILERILETAFEILPADRGAILLADAETQQLMPRIAKLREGGRERFILSRSILSEVVSTKSGILSADAGQDARFGDAESVMSEGVRSAMSVPILYDNELLGVMHLDSQVASGVFSQNDLELFSSIASQAAIAIKNAYLTQSIQEETRNRLQLQRFLSPSLVDQLARGEMVLGGDGSARTVTVLFADVRGFTRMSESMPPARIVAMLNEVFDRLLEVLFRHNGTFDKYIGDEIMALFGAPVDIPDPAGSAVRCAVAMQAAIADLNVRRTQAGEPPIAIGVGIHTGEAVCGAIGSAKTLQYTAIGDAVNTASRVCGVARPGQVLITEATRAAASHAFDLEPLPPATLKGKSEPIRCHVVRGAAPGAGHPPMTLG
jgi:adenylate cyclase